MFHRVNSVDAAQRYPRDLLSRFASKLFPKKSHSVVFFWLFVAAAFLFMTFAATLLRISEMMLYLGIAGFGGALASGFFRTSGLIAAYGVLGGLLIYFYPSLGSDERLWTTGLLFSWAVDCFIILLTVDEVESIFRQSNAFCEQRSQDLQQQLHHMKKAQDQQREALDEELSRWKEEAEQRRIEKSLDEKKLSLIQSEIELLTEQKEEFIKAAYEAQREQLVCESQLENLQNAYAGLEREKQLFIEENHLLKTELKQSDGLFKQLRAQFDEKSRILTKTRKELFQAQGKWMSLERELLEKEIVPEQGESLLFEQTLFKLDEENLSYEDEVNSLETLISQILSL